MSGKKAANPKFLRALLSVRLGKDLIPSRRRRAGRQVPRGDIVCRDLIFTECLFSRFPSNLSSPSAKSGETRLRSSFPSGVVFAECFFPWLGIEALCRVARVFALGKAWTTW